MSLHAAAQHLSSRGRGPDDTLVHMSRGEVKSLNDLAMAHGGHLTINPDTGLPEAGFLKSILPMVAGLGLTAMSGGALSPLMASMLVGGGTAAVTGNLKKGLMAGLGAYGGAGLGSSLLGTAGQATTAVTPYAEAAAETAPEIANPLAGLDVSGATTAGVNPTAAVQTAPEAFTSPVTGPSPIPSNALPAQGAFNPTQVTSMPGTNYAPSVNPTVAPSPATQMPSMDSLANQVTPAQSGIGSQAAVPLPTDDYSKYAQTRGMEAGAANVNVGPTVKPSFTDNLKSMGENASFDNVVGWAKENPYSAAGMAASVYYGMQNPSVSTAPVGDSDMGQRYSYSAEPTNPLPTPDSSGREQKYFNPTYTKISNEEAKNLYGFAAGGPVEQMSDAASLGANTNYPLKGISTGAYATPWQTPVPENVILGSSNATIDPYTGAKQDVQIAPQTQFASGGLSDLGGYSDGGRLLKGPGDGVSDSIPAMIGKKQPARLADGEFVVPARIVSELGNGSTEAGARKLYAMLDRVQAARKKSIGKDKVAHNSRADKLLPA